MSAPPSGQGEPIEDHRQLVEHIALGEKPKADWRIGTEHEKFGFTRRRSARRCPMRASAASGPCSRAWPTRFGWEPVLENGRADRARQGEGGNITLEPGGQFELSGARVQTFHQTCSEVHEHLAQVRDGGRAARHRHARAWASSRSGGARTSPGCPRAATSIMGELHAEGRLARPRHDAPDLHHPGQSRLRRRKPTW